MRLIGALAATRTTLQGVSRRLTCVVGVLAAGAIAVGCAATEIVSNERFAASGSARYEVTFARSRSDDDGAYREAIVEARLIPDDGVVGLRRAGADTGLYHQWATFLTRIEARNQAGELLELVYEPHGVWRVADWSSGPIDVRYSLALQHDRFSNEPGDDELAYARPYGVMWTTRALLMEGAPSDDVEVVFNPPDEWRVSTPWERVSANEWRFRPDNVDDLLDAAVLAGGHEEATLDVGGVEARIAFGPPVAGLVEPVRGLIGAYLGGYAALFDAPPTDDFLVIGADASFVGGGVMGRTISLSIDLDAPTEEVQLTTAYLIAHEGFHLWNATWRVQPGAEGELEWLAEGSAEYYAFLASLRAGLITEDQFFAFAAEKYAAYRDALQSGSTIAEAAGSKNADEGSYSLIYDGGFALCFGLDLLIRGESGGSASLDDVMRVFHARYGEGGGSSATLQSFAGEIERVSGLNLEGDIDAFVHGGQEIPLIDALSYIGMEVLDAKGGVGVSATATAEQIARRAAWLTGE